MRRLNFHVATILLTVFLAIVLAVYPSIQENVKVLDQSRSNYLEAIHQTRSQLVALTRETAASSALAQNVTWQLPHAIKKNLEAEMSRGQLDELILFNQNCLPIASASLKAYPTKNCRTDSNNSASLEPRLSWHQADGTPYLAFRFPFQGEQGAPLLLYGFVHLNDDWLHRYTELEGLAHQLALDIKPTKLKAQNSLIADGFDGAGNAHASLVTNSFFLRVSPALMWWAYRLAGLSIMGLFIFSLLDWWNRRSILLKAKNEKHALVGWLKEQVSKTSGSPSLDHIDDGDDAFTERAKNLTLQLQEIYQTRTARLNEQIEDLKKELQTQRIIVQNQETELNHLSSFESLAIQIHHGAETLSKKLSEIESAIEDVTDIGSHGLHRNAQALRSIINEWQSAIQARGTRRFLRSLAEQYSSSGTSLLDEQIGFIQQLTDQISTQAINLNVSLQKTFDHLRASRKLSEHWRTLVEQDDSQFEYCETAIAPTLMAQELLSQHKKYSSIKFVNLFSFSDKITPPHAPTSKCSAALYHAYLALLNQIDLNQHALVKIGTRIVKDSQGFSLVIGFENPEAPFLSDIEINEQELSLAKRQLNNYAVSIDQIRTPDGFSAISLSWRDNRITRSGKARSHANSRLTQPIRETSPSPRSL